MSELEYEYDYKVEDKILEFIALCLEDSEDSAVEISKIKDGFKDIPSEVIDDYIKIMNGSPRLYIGKLLDGHRVWLKDNGKKRIILLHGGDPFLR